MNWHSEDDVTVLLYLEDALSAAERRRFEDHMEDCRECRLELEAARRLQGLTRSWQEEEPPQPLVRQIQGKLQPRRQPWIWAAAAILLVFLGFHALKPGTPQAQQQTAPSQVAQGTPPVVPEEAPVVALATRQQAWSTQQDASVIAFAGQVLTLGPHTRLKVESQSGNHYLLRLKAGDVRVQEHGETIAVVTEHLRVDPLGTDYHVFHTPQRSRVELYTGSVQVTPHSSHKTTRLLAGGSLEWPAPIPAPGTRPQVPVQTPVLAPPKLPAAAYPVRVPTAVPASPTPPPIPDSTLFSDPSWRPGPQWPRGQAEKREPREQRIRQMRRPWMQQQRHPNRRQGVPI